GGAGACCGAEVICTGPATAPRLRITRFSPSRTSTVFKSADAISSTILDSRATSIGLPAGADGAADGAPGLGRFLLFCFSLNVATLEAPVEGGKHLAP